MVEISIVLQTAHHNAGSDALLIGKGNDSRSRKDRTAPQERVVRRLGNQRVRRECVRFALPIVLITAGQPFYEDVPATMP